MSIVLVGGGRDVTHLMFIMGAGHIIAVKSLWSIVRLWPSSVFVCLFVFEHINTIVSSLCI